MYVDADSGLQIIPNPLKRDFDNLKKNLIFENHDFQKIGRRSMKTCQICMKIRKESDFHYPGVPK